MSFSTDAGARRRRREARVTAVPLTRDDVVVALAEGDDQVLDDWASGRPVSAATARAALRRGLRPGTLTPALCGSAITGAGLPLLRDALVTLLPRPSRRQASEPPRSSPSTATSADAGRGCGCGRASCGSATGCVRGGRPARVTEVAVSTPAGLRPGVAGAGQIAVVRGPSARIGDAVGRPPRAGCTGSRRPRCKPSRAGRPDTSHGALRGPCRARRRGPAHRPTARRSRR